MINKLSAEWTEYKAYLEAKIAEAHIELEAATLDTPGTIYLRGKIKAWRDLLAVGEGEQHRTFDNSPNYHV